jgi:glycosyltransferase involved in cell wall biosynthesis
MTPLSFITVIKNRTNIKVSHNKKLLELHLFENNLRSLISLIQPSDQWEFVIVDYESTDVNMSEFVDTLPKADNLIFKVFTVKGTFDKGAGLNYGASLVTNPIVFFLDADMMIKTRSLFDDIETFVVQQNKVLFPICWSYKNPEHTQGWKRGEGTGNVIQKRETIVPYVNNKKWGHEDKKNYEHFVKIKKAHRTYYDQGFVHQWHPNEIKHIFYTDSK